MKQKRCFLNSRGETLVEAIVTFALTAILLLMAVTAASAALKAFYRMQSVAHAAVVSDTLLNKIEGELSRARADGETIVLGQVDGNSAVDFTAKDGSRICITRQNGYLRILQHQWDGSTASLEPVWSFGENMYQGFLISDLQFMMDPQENTPGNLILVRLTLQKGENNSHTALRYVQCEQFDQVSELADITEAEITP